MKTLIIFLIAALASTSLTYADEAAKKQESTWWSTFKTVSTVISVSSPLWIPVLTKKWADKYIKGGGLLVPGGLIENVQKSMHPDQGASLAPVSDSELKHLEVLPEQSPAHLKVQANAKTSV